MHVVVAAAIVVLVINDHLLKRAFPSVLTGKLSDFAGLTFFPLLLEALLELGLDAFGRYRGPSRRRLIACIALTGVSFAWMKTTAIGERAYELGLGAIRWPLRSIGSILSGDGLARFEPASIVRDPTDLIALIALVLAYRVGTSRPVGG